MLDEYPTDAAKAGEGLIAVDPVDPIEEIETNEFADPPMPTVELGRTAERPTDVFVPAGPPPDGPGRSDVWLEPPGGAAWAPPTEATAAVDPSGRGAGFDNPVRPPVTPPTAIGADRPEMMYGASAVRGAEAGAPWPSEPPWADPGASPWAAPVPDEWSDRTQAWPPSPAGAPRGETEFPPPAAGGGGFPPPLPRAPMQPGLPAGSGQVEPTAAAPDRPLNGVKLAILVGMVSAVVAAVITSGVFLATGSRPDQNKAAGPSATGSRVAGNSLDIQQLLAKSQPSVVAIHVKSTTSRGSQGGAGTGVIISDDGLVLTNAHVVAGADLDQMNVTLSDGTDRSVELVGSLVDNDIALIKIKNGSGFTPAQLGVSNDVRVGDDVVAIGNALNLGGPPSVTKGVVSAKDRVIEDDEGNRFGDLIQTDAAINPGNSGGPLVNAAGEIVGINTAVIGGSGGRNVQNIGFAIAIDKIKPMIDQIKSGKGTVTPDQAFLGIQSRSVSESSQAEKDGFEISAPSGAVVMGVTNNSAAAEAGLRQGDVITSIDGQPVNNKEDVGNIIRAKKPGDSIVVEYERRGVPRQAESTLKSRKDSGGG